MKTIDRLLKDFTQSSLTSEDISNLVAERDGAIKQLAITEIALFQIILEAYPGISQQEALEKSKNALFAASQEAEAIKVMEQVVRNRFQVEDDRV